MAETLITVFDLGGVFIDWDPMLLFRKLFETEEEAVWFSKTVCTPDWNLEFDAGMPYREGIVALMAKFPQYWREIDAFDTRWDEMFGPFHQGTIDIHNELIDADLPTFAITNFAWEKWQTVLPKWNFLEKFDGVVVSGIENACET